MFGFGKKQDEGKPDTRLFGLVSNRPIKGMSGAFTGVSGPTRQTVKQLKKATRRHGEDRALIEAVPDDHSRFQCVFREYYGLDDAGIDMVHRRTYWHCLFWIVGAIGLFTGMAVIEAFATVSLPPFGGYTLLCPMPYFAAMVVKNAFLNWQARERRLSAFRTWAVNPAAWLPMLPEREAKAA